LRCSIFCNYTYNFTPYGEERWTNGATPTDFTFTGQRNEAGFGLMDYNARYYSARLGRFVSPDTVVPEPENSQSWNRYAYVFNNPLNYIDPSGHDPLDEEWEQQFKNDHGRDPTDEDRQDRLVSLMFSGSGQNGTWTAEDWKRYSNDRNEYLSGRKNGQPLLLDDRNSGLTRFKDNVENLLAYYKSDEEKQFVRALGLIYAGIPYDRSYPLALLSVWNGPQQFTYLHESTAGFDPIYIDSKLPGDDIAHHYIGNLMLAYFTTAVDAQTINWLRDYDNPGDLLSGQEGAQHGRIINLSRGGHSQLPSLISTLGNSTAQPYIPNCVLRGGC
jgi:RHS repeat-associated protein